MKLTLEEMIAYSYCNARLNCPDDCPYINTKLCDMIQHMYIKDYFDSVYDILSKKEKVN